MKRENIIFLAATALLTAWIAFENFDKNHDLLNMVIAHTFFFMMISGVLWMTTALAKIMIPKK